jgi:hypothetical protein
LRDELVDPEAFLALRAFDRHAEALRQFAGAAGMVDVAVGEQDLLDLTPSRAAVSTSRRRCRRRDRRRRPAWFRCTRAGCSSARRG